MSSDVSTKVVEHGEHRVRGVELRVVEGRDRGAVARVGAEGVRVGSGALSDLRLTDPTVSRLHCEVRNVDDCAGMPVLQGCVRSALPDESEQWSQEFQLAVAGRGAIDGLLGAYHYTDDPRGAGILLVFRASCADPAAAIAGDDADMIGFFAPGELPPISHHTHRSAIEDWVVEQRRRGSS